MDLFKNYAVKNIISNDYIVFLSKLHNLNL